MNLSYLACYVNYVYAICSTCTTTAATIGTATSYDEASLRWRSGRGGRLDYCSDVPLPLMSLLPASQMPKQPRTLDCPRLTARTAVVYNVQYRVTSSDDSAKLRSTAPQPFLALSSTSENSYRERSTSKNTSLRINRREQPNK